MNTVQGLVEALRKIASCESRVKGDVVSIARETLAAFESAKVEVSAQDLGFISEKDLSLIGEMLTEKDLSFAAMARSAIRLYQLIHKGTMDGATFSLTKDGKPWPDVGPKLSEAMSLARLETADTDSRAHPPASAPFDKGEASQLFGDIEAMVNFAYEQGFHEMGFDPVKRLREMVNELLAARRPRTGEGR